MHIIALGLNHTTAPVQLRERLVYSEDQIRASLARLSCGKISSPFSEMVILSTCNRIEIYSTSNELSFDMLEVFLSETSVVPIDEIRPSLYRFEDVDAVQHLFEVAAGLDSLVVGEPQILGQVTKALELARGQSTAGPILNRLFQSAIHAGKRARTETAISRNPASVSSLAASKAEKAVHSITEAQVVILGAGEMAELAVEALRKRGASRILVVNRTLERAQTLVQRWNAQAATFENINSALVSADILIASTGAPHTIITSEMIKDAMNQRNDRPLVLIDIAVPRDIDPGVTDVPNVRLYDMDSLNDNLEHSLAKRKAEVPQVKMIVDEEVLVFEEYMRSLEMIPIIADMRQQAEAIRQAVLKKSLSKLPGITDVERERIEAMTQALVKKILDAPTNRLRVEALSPRAYEYAQITRALFNLSDKKTYPTSTAAD
ncbi:MAG TPA: glutamyl-tRNA reductase [Anaerolineales bacterium]|nr:glutamyl-tRNA reductase [Anaerolineales bacterium]